MIKRAPGAQATFWRKTSLVTPSDLRVWIIKKWRRQSFQTWTPCTRATVLAKTQFQSHLQTYESGIILIIANVLDRRCPSDLRVRNSIYSIAHVHRRCPSDLRVWSIKMNAELTRRSVHNLKRQKINLSATPNQPSNRLILGKFIKCLKMNAELTRHSVHKPTWLN